MTRIDLNCPMRPAASEQSIRELSQKRALAPVHRRRINSLRHKDVFIKIHLLLEFVSENILDLAYGDHDYGSHFDF